MRIRRYLMLAGLLLSFGPLSAQSDGIPEQPSPPKLVNNLSVRASGFLSASETEQLEKKLDDFANETSNQITIVIVDSLNGYEVNDFATKIGEQWHVGQKKFDNGVVILLVNPTGAAGTRDGYIAVGYGLEPVIPDIVAKKVLENEIFPELKSGNNFQALDKGVEKLIGFAKGEFNTSEYANDGDALSFFKKHWLLTLVGVFFLLFLFSRGGGGGMTMTRFGGTYWGGSFGGSSSSSSGGFGGFGGGSFGGGGAGGKW
jgi:uncharacterized protein